MDSPRQTISPPAPSLSAALQRLWERFLPDIQDRLSVIEAAASAAAAGALSPEQQQAAHAAAHKLAGALGMFGLTDATAPARETELLYAASTLPSRENAARLSELAASLRSLIESHTC